MKRNLQEGLTLLEILIVMGIGSVIGVLLISTLVQSNGLFQQQNTRLNQGVNLNDALPKITESIRTGSAVVANYPTVNPQYTTGGQTLVLSLASINSSGDIIENTYDYIVIAKDSSNPTVLKKYLFADPNSFRKNQNEVLITNLSLIQFLYLDNNGGFVTPTSASKVNVIVNLLDKIGVDNETSSASAQVNLRNN